MKTNAVWARGEMDPVRRAYHLHDTPSSDSGLWLFPHVVLVKGYTVANDDVWEEYRARINGSLGRHSGLPRLV